MKCKLHVDNQLHSMQSSSFCATSFSPQCFNSHLKSNGPETISEKAPYPRKVSKERSLRPVVAGIIDSVEAFTNLFGVPSSWRERKTARE